MGGEMKHIKSILVILKSFFIFLVFIPNIVFEICYDFIKCFICSVSINDFDIKIFQYPSGKTALFTLPVKLFTCLTTISHLTFGYNYSTVNAQFFSPFTSGLTNFCYYGEVEYGRWYDLSVIQFYTRDYFHKFLSESLEPSGIFPHNCFNIFSNLSPYLQPFYRPMIYYLEPKDD